MRYETPWEACGGDRQDPVWNGSSFVTSNVHKTSDGLPPVEDVALKDFPVPSKDSYLQSETQALIQQERSVPGFSPTPSSLDPGGPPLPHSRSQESVRSLRRASSLHDIDGMRDQWNDLKPNNVNSTSDSDLMRHRAIGRIPQVTLTFGSDRLRPPSPTEIEIIAPSKIKDRTQNVSEKVTQVTQLKQHYAV
ncbi:hypothetical protein SRHO_G00195830 [Serrasalmus rhombeus]